MNFPLEDFLDLLSEENLEYTFKHDSYGTLTFLYRTAGSNEHWNVRMDGLVKIKMEKEERKIRNQQSAYIGAYTGTNAGTNVGYNPPYDREEMTNSIRGEYEVAVNILHTYWKDTEEDDYVKGLIESTKGKSIEEDISNNKTLNEAFDAFSDVYTVITGKKINRKSIKGG